MQRRNPINVSFIVCVVTALLLGPEPAHAETGEGDQVQKLIDELRQELDRGERDRLADPWFLRDLRGILDRYDWPWRQMILSDDFSGQGPGPDAPWQVTAGEFLIDWRHGLRSVIDPRPPTQAKEVTQEEAVSALIGTFLNQAMKQPAGEAGPAPEQASYATVIAPLPISNAFALEVELSARSIGSRGEGRLEFGSYQDANSNAGYRLALMTGTQAGAPSVELLRVSSRGTISLIEFHDQPIQIQDQGTHSLSWTRDTNGSMVIQLDGQELIRATDRGFRDPFDGLVVVNGGGDFALRRVTLYGTE